MADRIWTESAGSTLEEVPRLRCARFGDGHELSCCDVYGGYWLRHTAALLRHGSRA